MQVHLNGERLSMGCKRNKRIVTTRKGMTLVEVMIAMMTIPAIMIAFGSLFKTFVRDIPQASQVVQQNTTVQNMLKQLRTDVDAAKVLPATFRQYEANDQLLLIELEDTVVCYRIQDGEVLREKLSDGQEETDDDATAWSVPNAEIHWRIWRKNSKGYAVEVKTYIKHKLRKKWQKKMANSHVYFLGLFPESADAR